MSEDRMQRLFAALDEAPVEPDPQFIARLRRTVHDVAAGEPGSSIDTIDESMGEAIMTMLDTDQSTSAYRSRLGVAAAVLLVAGIGIAVFVATRSDEPRSQVQAVSQPEVTDDAVNLVGIWHRTTSDPVYLQFLEDGTSYLSDSLENVNQGLGTQWNYRVEGTQLFWEEAIGACSDRDGYETGSYEVRLLENGNLQFVVIEDECVRRVSILYGRPDDGVTTREFEPVS